jgi:Ca-activated chloride channel family protein
LEFDGVTVYDVYPPLERLPDLFAGTQLMVLGRYRGETDDITLRLHGTVGDEEHFFAYGNQYFRSNAGGEELIPRLWAQRRVGELLNAIRLHGEDPELVNSIIRLSIRYGIVTPYTAYIITEEDIFTEEDVSHIAVMMQPTTTALAMQASGYNAVNAAQNAGGMYQSTLPPTMAPDIMFMPTTRTPAPSSTWNPNGTVPPTPPAQTVQIVGDRAFVWRNGVWIDTTYNPEDMRLHKIVFLSDDYFALLNTDARVAEFYALGDHVIFVLDDHAYEVGPE